MAGLRPRTERRPACLAPAERRPAILPVHDGPTRVPRTGACREAAWNVLHREAGRREDLERVPPRRNRRRASASRRAPLRRGPVFDRLPRHIRCATPGCCARFVSLYLSDTPEACVGIAQQRGPAKGQTPNAPVTAPTVPEGSSRLHRRAAEIQSICAQIEGSP